LYECPLGKVHREAPHAYDAINVHGMAEGSGFELLQQPRWMQQAFRVIGSEQERHRQRKMSERQAKNDSRYGAAVLRGR
jgi:hypothetical protein